MRKKTIKEFKEDALKAHGNIYDYSKVEYINTMTKVIIVCPQHGEWEVTPDNHVNKKSGCPKCKGFNLDKEKKIELANQIHNNKYDYSLINDKLIKNQKKYKIQCSEHGIFIQSWNNHYNMGQGCPQCATYGRPKVLEEGIKNSWSKEYTREYMNSYKKGRRKKDIKFKIITYLRARIYACIKKYNHDKKDTSIKELGCSIEEYIVHLEQQFDENMSWDNYGTYWEIDHIKPLSKGGSFHYTNTQPLTVKENRNKSNKIKENFKKKLVI